MRREKSDIILSMADKKSAEKKAEIQKLPDVDLKVESTTRGSRVSLTLDLGDLHLDLDLPANGFAARYLEEKGIIGS